MASTHILVSYKWTVQKKRYISFWFVSLFSFLLNEGIVYWMLPAFEVMIVVRSRDDRDADRYCCCCCCCFFFVDSYHVWSTIVINKGDRDDSDVDDIMMLLLLILLLLLVIPLLPAPCLLLI